MAYHGGLWINIREFELCSKNGRGSLQLPLITLVVISWGPCCDLSCGLYL